LLSIKKGKLVEEIGNGIVGIFLIIGTITDCKTKKVPGMLVIAFPIIGMLFSLFFKEGNIWNWILGGVFGACFFILAKVTKEAIGYADAWILTGIGVLLGINTVLTILFGALFLTIPISIILLLFKKGTKKTKLPFIPFLFVAFVIQILF